MPISVVSAVNSLLREKYSNSVRSTFSTDLILMMMFQKLTREQINERGGRYAMRTRRSNSFVGGSENLVLPTPKPGEYKHFVPQLRSAYASGGFSNYMFWQQNVETISREEIRNVKGMVAQQVSDETDDFKQHLEEICFRDGKGKIASAITAVVVGALGTATVDPATANYSVNEQMIGRTVNFYSSAGVIKVTGAATSTITAVNETTGVVTFDSVPTNAAIGDFMVWESSYDKMPFGLESLIQSQDLTDFQGVNITGYSNLKSIVVDAAGSAFDVKNLDLIKVRTMKKMGVKNAKEDFVYLTHPIQVNAIKFGAYGTGSVMQTTQNRGSSTLDPQYDNVELGGKKIYMSQECGERDIWGLRMSAMRRFSLFEPNLISLTGNENGWLMPPPSGSSYQHAYLYWFAFYGNLFISDPRACFRYTNLAKAGLY